MVLSKREKELSIKTMTIGAFLDAMSEVGTAGCNLVGNLLRLMDDASLEGLGTVLSDRLGREPLEADDLRSWVSGWAGDRSGNDILSDALNDAVGFVSPREWVAVAQKLREDGHAPPRDAREEEIGFWAQRLVFRHRIVVTARDDEVVTADFLPGGTVGDRNPHWTIGIMGGDRSTIHGGLDDAGKVIDEIGRRLGSTSQEHFERRARREIPGVLAKMELAPAFDRIRDAALYEVVQRSDIRIILRLPRREEGEDIVQYIYAYPIVGSEIGWAFRSMRVVEKPVAIGLMPLISTVERWLTGEVKIDRNVFDFGIDDDLIHATMEARIEGQDLIVVSRLTKLDDRPARRSASKGRLVNLGTVKIEGVKMAMPRFVGC